MKTKLKQLSIGIAGACLIALSGCGGGGGGAASSPVPSQLVGVAAIGSPLANAPVSISNMTGASPCSQASITTTPLGSYTCTLKAGETAPFFIVVTDPTGNTAPLVSIATTTPTAGTPLTVNATPLTTAIVAQLNGGNALGVVSDKTKYIPANFELIKTNVIAQITPVLIRIGAPFNYDPFTTSITAATAGQAGNTADQVLDVIKISHTQTGALAFSTIENPTAIEIASTTVGTALDAPTTAVSDLTAATQLAAQAFNNCFALPVNQRVTLVNGAIAGFLGSCQGMVTSANVPAGAPAFKHNGYSAEQIFYGWLTSDAMTGARFSVPEIMLYLPANTNSGERAVINIRGIDNFGNPFNRISVAQLLPSSSSSAHPSSWWITGNQGYLDVRIATQIRRTEELSPNASSGYQNGLSIYIDGVNNTAYDSALVTGPGLPTLGLWYFRQANSNSLVMATQRSAPPVTTFTEVCSSCSSFWISRTSGLTGVGAKTYGTQHSGLNWAHSSDGSYTGTTGTRPTKGGIYTFSLYNNGTFYKTETRTLLTDLVDANQEVNLEWNGIGPQTVAALDPSNGSLNGALSSLPIDWTKNPSAELINNIWVSMSNGGFGNYAPIVLGASSVIATPAPGTTFTTLIGPNGDRIPPSDGVYGGYREVGFSYRMLDGSSKNAVYYYSP